MKTSHRPKYNAVKDTNHAHILKDLSGMVGGWQGLSDSGGHFLNVYIFNYKGWPFLLKDMSRVGGMTLDLSLYFMRDIVDIEVKQPGLQDDLTEGEKLYFQFCPYSGRIVTDAEGILSIARELIDRLLWFEKAHEAEA